MSGEYRWNTRLTALNKLLADLYPTEDASRRVVDLAGLPPAFIKFHDAALINWYNILDDARKRGRVEAIISVAQDDFPGHKDLASFSQPMSAGEEAKLASVSPSDAGKLTAAFSPDTNDSDPAMKDRSDRDAVPDDIEPALVKNHIVVLVHGIRDYALWQDSIRATLEEAGFKAEPTNYDRFNLIKFLIPFWFFRRQAIEDVWRQLRIIVHNNPDTPISVIAHSFGTFVLSHLMDEGFDLKFHRIIFCGSVVPYSFRFEQIQDRFMAPIINEVGTRDIWPAVAESVTTGYGASGTYGFRRPLVRDRWHNGAGHGYFLDREFCKKYWIPFLRDGKIVPASAEAESPRVWLQTLSIVKVKYVLLALIGTVLLLAFHGFSWTCTTGVAFPWCQRAGFSETWSDQVGGPGGAVFSPITCRSSEKLVGLHGKAGAGPFIFSIGPVCAAAQFDRQGRLTSMSQDLRKGDVVGSDQGDGFELTCPPKTVVIGSELDSAVVDTNFGLHEYLVTPLNLRCSSVLESESPSRRTVTGSGERQPNASRKPFACPNGSAVFGIRGKAGQMIDAISLGCRGA